MRCERVGFLRNARATAPYRGSERCSRNCPSLERTNEMGEGRIGGWIEHSRTPVEIRFLRLDPKTGRNHGVLWHDDNPIADEIVTRIEV
jgi:hypothetical protein